jgi:DNA-directed RNA polymerase specialized sigma24 family protein
LIASQTVTILIEKEEEPTLTCKLLTFAISIAKRQWGLVEQKKREVLMPAGFFDDIQSTEDIYYEVEKSARRLLVNDCLQKLTDKCKRLLNLFCRDFKPEEACKEMGYASKSVYQVKKSECMDRLKKVIEDSPEYKELLDVKQEDTVDERNG